MDRLSCGVVAGFFIGMVSGVALAEKPTRVIYLKDFVRTPGLLSEFGCPDEIEAEDLIQVGLYPVGFIIENHGDEPFVISEKTFRLPPINLALIVPAILKKSKTFFDISSIPLLGPLIVAATITGCGHQIGFGKVGPIDVSLAAGLLAGGVICLKQWERNVAIRRWFRTVSVQQSRGGSLLVLPGHTQKFILLLTRPIYTSSFPLFFDSFPAHEVQTMVPVTLLENNADDLRIQIYASDMPDDIKKELCKEADHVSSLPPGSHEAPGIRTYVEWVLDLPWSDMAPETQDLEQARAILDAQHYGLKEVKERVLDIIAMRILKSDAPPPIICLVGPPGTGKTSLARAIAQSLGRPFERISVGGVDDEADIRGHRRTYIGAIPGRIMTALYNAGVKNPLILIDEIDKMGSRRSDAARAAILEVLDLEQNRSFRDHYLGVPFDCSQILFITTANTVYDIPAALIDRMEIIQLSSYTQDEKVEIVMRYTWPRAKQKTGLESTEITITADVVRMIIDRYTAEAGIRELERLIQLLCMKVGRLSLEGNPITEITAEFVTEQLGHHVPYPQDMAQKIDAVGIVNGLSRTHNGGATAPIEVVLMPGTGELILTGQLGDVLQESARIALSYVRSHAKQWKIPDELFTTRDIHIHLPGGAEPKDGPSGGIALVTALVSACTGRKVDCKVAMTGEIDLPGSVLAIGGLKEKMLAAHRQGMRVVIAPVVNKPEVADVLDQVPGLELLWVDSLEQVLNRALI